MMGVAAVLQILTNELFTEQITLNIKFRASVFGRGPWRRQMPQTTFIAR